MNEVVIEPAYLKPCLRCTTSRQQNSVVVPTINAQVAATSPAHSTSSSTGSSPTYSSASTSPPYSSSGVDSGPEVGKAKGFCDSSSDSGYDDISPGGGIIVNQAKKQQNTVAAQAISLLVKPG